MLKGLAITPPVLGRISIGKVIERNGKRLPEKDDQFTLTTQLQGREGWLLHPLDDTLRSAQDGKIRSIPVRLMFGDPALNFRADYSLFNRETGRPVCVGNGESCRRPTSERIETLPCPSPDGCALAQGKACKPYARLNVIVEAGKDETDDPLGTFIFRTTGFNSIRTLTARLHYFQAISGNKLACLPLELKLRGKTTAQSFGTPIYYVDLVLRSGLTLETALQQANQRHEQYLAAGFDQEALDQAARIGLGNGTFEESEDEGQAVMEEFYPDLGGALKPEGTNDYLEQMPPSPPPDKPGSKSLSRKLTDKRGGSPCSTPS